MEVKCKGCGKEMDISELINLEVFAYDVTPNKLTILDGDGDCPQCKQWIRFSFEAIIFEKEDYEKKCDEEYEEGFNYGIEKDYEDAEEVFGEGD